METILVARWRDYASTFALEVDLKTVLKRGFVLVESRATHKEIRDFLDQHPGDDTVIWLDDPKPDK